MYKKYAIISLVILILSIIARVYLQSEHVKTAYTHQKIQKNQHNKKRESYTSWHSFMKLNLPLLYEKILLIDLILYRYHYNKSIHSLHLRQFNEYKTYLSYYFYFLYFHTALSYCRCHIISLTDTPAPFFHRSCSTTIYF